MLKSFAQSSIGVTVASALIGSYLRVTLATTRWRHEGASNLANVETAQGGYIIAFWHHQLMLFPAVRGRTDRPVYMLASASRDGEIIARAVHRFGITFIRGSSANINKSRISKSGAPAILQMTAALANGAVIGMTPDGPRGPAQSVQAGIIRLAARTGVPILPVAAATSRRKRLHTWDRFCLALPFATGAFVAGRPIMVGKDPADSQMALEAALNAATARAENLANGSLSGTDTA